MLLDIEQHIIDSMRHYKNLQMKFPSESLSIKEEVKKEQIDLKRQAKFVEQEKEA